MQINIYQINTDPMVFSGAVAHEWCLIMYDFKLSGFPVPSKNVSLCMISNYLASLYHQKIKLFLKAVKINRPLKPVKRNIMDVATLKQLSALCSNIFMGSVYRAVFLVAYFAFLRLLNMAPHMVSTFDHSRHLTANDVTFTSKYVKMAIKWSKTVQSRDRLHVITIPKLKASLICPYRALKKLFKLYAPFGNQPLFQVQVNSHLVTDSKIRKCLSKLGLDPHQFTFYTFKHSGATVAYNSHIPIQQIKRHGSWASDCVCTYIQKNQAFGENITDALVALSCALMLACTYNVRTQLHHVYIYCLSQELKFWMGVPPSSDIM